MVCQTRESVRADVFEHPSRHKADLTVKGIVCLLELNYPSEIHSEQVTNTFPAMSLLFYIDQICMCNYTVLIFPIFVVDFRNY